MAKAVIVATMFRDGAVSLAGETSLGLSVVISGLSARVFGHWQVGDEIYWDDDESSEQQEFRCPKRESISTGRIRRLEVPSIDAIKILKGG